MTKIVLVFYLIVTSGRRGRSEAKRFFPETLFQLRGSISLKCYPDHNSPNGAKRSPIDPTTGTKGER